ncbi:MAG: EAL domain-containing protein [Sterolibacterium sp.]
MTERVIAEPANLLGTGSDLSSHRLDAWKLASPTVLLIIFAVLGAAIAVVGLLGFGQYRDNMQHAVQRDLFSITDAKVQQLLTWRDARKRDANALVGDASFRAEFEHWLKAGMPKDERGKRFLHRLTALRDAYGYEDILLYDSTASLVLTTNPDATPPTSSGMDMVRQVLRGGGIKYSDIHYLRPDGREHVRLGVLAPIHPPDTESGLPDGAVLLRTDPTKELFPSLQAWPMSTESGETFLAKHEGGNIVYLTDLRYRKAQGMATRFPVTHETLLAAQVARGHEGFLEGIDYRGVAVIGAARLIPGTSWLIVSKIDKEEIYAPIRRANWIVGIVSMLFILGAGVTTAIWWRNQRNSLLAKVYETRLMHESSKRRLENFSKYANDIILLSDEQAHIVEANDRAIEAYGYPLAELQGMHASELRDPAYRDSFDEDMRRWTTEGIVYETVQRHRSGRVFPVEVSARLVELDGRRFQQAIIRDISERKQAEEAQRSSAAQIIHLAHHDSLTGLLNRYSLQGRLEQALATVRRERRALAVMFIDMDRFKTINDTLGHGVGDALLVKVAHRLRDSVRESDIVARFGGDEFVVVLTEVDGPTAAARVADKILHTLSVSYHIEENELHSSPSIGLAFYPYDGEDSETLMKHADTAMYHAKSQGRNNVQFFTTEMNRVTVERLRLDHDLRAALEEAQFELHYQPKLDVRTGCVVGVEALVRWRHPRDGLVSPLKFIPVAEETGLIIPLGEWVLNEACRQLREWQDQGLTRMTMAVNLSAHQLRSPALLTYVSQTLERHGLTGADLELEVTESVAMANPEASIGRLHALRNLGVRLSIDDFGTGYSSLSYLKLLPIHTLKLDRSFVRDIETDANDAAICTATIALAHNMGLSVVGEGVETEAQRAFLAMHQCDILQGYLFSKPLPAQAALAVLKEIGTARGTTDDFALL